MKTVWVIEQGEYSDYRVVGVYTSRENAEMIAARLNVGRGYDEATVAEWPLDPGVEAINQGLRRYTVHMLRDGTVEKSWQQEGELSGYALADEVRVWRRTQAPAYRGQDKPDVLVASVWAQDETHAVKTANEKRAQLIASGEWDAPDA